MKIESRSLNVLHKMGVYTITNLINNKVYIGSTTQSFVLRYRQHLYELNKSIHKNRYLQASYLKNGAENFEFKVQEITEKSETLDREQHYIDLFKSFDKNLGYNINPIASGTPNLSNEVLEKRIASFTITIRKAMEYYRMIKSGEITLDQVPVKYLQLVVSKLNHVPWNKGKNKTTTDFSHLKGVKKKITNKSIEGRIKFKETMRSRRSMVNVYDYKGNFIKSFKCIADIVDYTQHDHDLPIVSRRICPDKKLKHQNIGHVCNGRTKHYKGLIFRYADGKLKIKPLKPSDIHPFWKTFPTDVLLHQEIDVEKEGKIGENCDVNTESANKELAFVEHRN